MRSQRERRTMEKKVVESVAMRALSQVHTKLANHTVFRLLQVKRHRVWLVCGTLDVTMQANHKCFVACVSVALEVLSILEVVAFLSLDLDHRPVGDDDITGGQNLVSGGIQVNICEHDW
jgi:hypothetical protein